MADAQPRGPLNGPGPALDAGTLARSPMQAPGPAGRPGPQQPLPGPVAEVPWSGGIPYAAGQAALVRIPVPGSGGLAIELQPRGRVPAGGSTSTLFFQDATGRRHLRLDYGYNVRTGTIDYHWNQRGTHASFGIADHAPAGPAGRAAHLAARYFRHAGRVLVVAGVAADLVAVVRADRPLRRATRAVAGWAGAWAGCKVVGAGGAALGSLGSPLGTAAGGVGGCIIGGMGGYFAGSAVAGEVYDWAANTVFEPLPESAAP